MRMLHGFLVIASVITLVTFAVNGVFLPWPVEAALGSTIGYCGSAWWKLRPRFDLITVDVLRQLDIASQPKYGLQLLDDSAGPLKRAGRGALYVYLGRLEELGLIEGEAAPTALVSVTRRHYTITPRGRRVLAGEEVRN
jgi:hypothetical protein